LNGDCDVLKHQNTLAQQNDGSHAQPEQEVLDALEAVEQNILRRLERLEDRVMECEKREHSSPEYQGTNMLAATTSPRHHSPRHPLPSPRHPLPSPRLPRCRWFRDESERSRESLKADHRGAVDNRVLPQPPTACSRTPWRAALQLHKEANDLFELLEMQRKRFEARLGCEVPLTMTKVANELMEAKNVAAELGKQFKRTARLLAVDGFLGCGSCCSCCHKQDKKAPAHRPEFSVEPVLVHQSVCPIESPLPTHRQWLQEGSTEASVSATQEVIASVPCPDHSPLPTHRQWLQEGSIEASVSATQEVVASVPCSEHMCI